LAQGAQTYKLQSCESLSLLESTLVEMGQNRISKYLYNQHLQKCIKTKDFKYI